MQKSLLASHKPVRDIACLASKKSKGGSSSPWQSSNTNSTTASSAAKLSEAAKAAARRAAQFTKQRQQRAYQLAEQQQAALQDSDSRGYAFSNKQRKGGLQTPAQTAALAAAAAANNAAGQYSDLKPYVEVVTQHLKQQQGAGDAAGSSGRGRGAKKAASRSLLEAHTAVFQAALDLELQQEWQEAEERLKSWPQSRLRGEGVALFGLAAAPDGAVARDVVVKFFVPEQALPFHSFSQGDILLVSQGDPLGDSQEAIVVDFSSRWIRLAMNPIAAAAVAAASGSWDRTSSSSDRSGSNGSSGRGSNGSSGRGSSGRSSGGRSWRAIWRLDLFANTVSHERCSEALNRFADAVQGSGQDGQGLVSGLLTQGQLQQQEALCRVLAGVLPPGSSMEAAAAQAPPWTKSPGGRDRLSAARNAVKTLVQEQRLNPSQGAAVTAALTRTVTLWQGPPGTGKTTTLLRFCEASLSTLPPGGQLLAVAASNVAVDQLVTGLLELGVSVVRLGQPAKVTPALRSVTLEALAAATAPGQAAVKLRQQLAEAAAVNRATRGGSSSRGRGRGGRGGRDGRGGGGAAGGGLWEQLLALEAAAAAEVLGKAQVVAATCVGAGDPVLQERFFEVLVLDEATQAPEPAALVAVAQKVQSVVMVGDPQQLPPTVRCQQAQSLGLGTSLFDRVQAMGLKPLLLDTQYRMHPSLAEFPSFKFYGGLLRSWPKPADRPLPEGLPWPNMKVPVMFIQCKGPEARTASSFSISRQREAADSLNEEPSSSRSSNDSRHSSSNGGSSGSSGGYSYFNEAEAAVVVDCLRQLLAAGMQPQDVCVITPYSGQVRSIQRLLSSDSNRPGERRVLDAAVASMVEVKSVDGFQGREKEVVIFSAVRSNSSGRVGFLSDSRRLNVALTRAKRGLVVVGDAATLRSDRVWSAWLAWAKKHGAVAGSAESM